MVVLEVVWIAKPGQESKTAEVLRQLAEAARKESGCLMFVPHVHRDDPRRFFIYEQYKDDAAHEAHRQTPHFKQLARGKLPEVADRKEGELYSPLD
jgi:autoinducer 2-degrading protein